MVGAAVAMMRASSLRRSAALAFVVLVAACSRTEPEPSPSRAASSSSPSAAAGPLVVAPPGLRVVPAPPGDVATVIKAAREEAKAQGRELVVYVGATWCEPCRYFHKAAAAGELDAAFPDLTVLEFDLDERREPLVAAGYVGELVPLFALPGPDGRASGQKLEGSVKGAGAVANITPRLKKLLGR